MSHSVLTELKNMEFRLCGNEQSKFVYVLHILDNESYRHALGTRVLITFSRQHDSANSHFLQFCERA